ncbi:MAG: response regulator [Gammaproteobacteria bacterium]|nr:response regulator [Gammaproteobacteria bacterium]
MSKYKIMIVDDEENILLSLKRMLNKEKHWEIETFTDPIKALEAANNSNFDVIISDYMMPHMNGVEFLVFTKENNPDAMRLMLSGNTNFDGLINAINKGNIFRYIAKPVKTTELKDTINLSIKFYDLQVENKRLAKQVKEQENELDNRERILKHFSLKHPKLAQVEWNHDGSISIEDDKMN